MKNTENTKQHVEWIDTAKGIGILSIMLGHVNYINWMAPYKVTIFFLISGYLYARNSTELTLRRAKHLAKKMLVPYFTFGFLFLLIDLLVALYQKESVMDSFLYNISLLFSFKGISTLWFLPTLLGAAIIALFLQRYGWPQKITWCAIVTILALSYSTQHTGRNAANSYREYVILTLIKMFVGSAFILYGYLYHDSSKKHSHISPKMGCILAGICLGITILANGFCYRTDLNHLILGQIPAMYPVFCIVQGSSILYLTEHTRLGRNKVLSYFGKNSIFFMLTHHGFKFCKIIHLFTSKRIENIIIRDSIEFLLLILIEVLLLKVWTIFKMQFKKSQGRN